VAQGRIRCRVTAREGLFNNHKEEKMENKVLTAMKKAGKPVRPGDVAKMLGVESKEVSKIINGLKKQGKVISPKRCYYSLND
jgi:Mn-dependent DtxR family transcriptional regulator